MYIALFSVCGNNSQNDESNSIMESNTIIESVGEYTDQNEGVENKEIEASNSGEGLVIVPGIYEVGGYVSNANYLK